MVAQTARGAEAANQSVGTDWPISAFCQVSGIELTIGATVPYEKGDSYPDSTFAAPAAPSSRLTIHMVGERTSMRTRPTPSPPSTSSSRAATPTTSSRWQRKKGGPLYCDFDCEALVSYLVGPLDLEVSGRSAESQGRITIIKDWRRCTHLGHPRGPAVPSVRASLGFQADVLCV